MSFKSEICAALPVLSGVKSSTWIYTCLVYEDTYIFHDAVVMFLYMLWMHVLLELGLEERDYVSECSIGLVETEDSNLIVVSFAAITVH